jgi:hypothetical protein
MGLIIALLIAIVVIVLIKYLMDWIGVPTPLSWVILLLVALIVLWQLWSRYGNSVL